MTTTTDKQADLAGPGIGTYEEVAQALPKDYESLLTPRETMEALFEVKRYIEEYHELGDKKEAAAATFAGLFKPGWLAIVTDAARTAKLS